MLPDIQEPVEETGVGIYATGMSNLDYKEFAQQRRLKYAMNIEQFCEEDFATLHPDVQGHYLATLRDIEKQAMTIDKQKQDYELAMLRLKQEDQSNEAQQQLIAMMAIDYARRQDRRDIVQIIPDPSVIPKKQLIPGETETGDQLEDYHSYKTRLGYQSDQE